MLMHTRDSYTFLGLDIEGFEREERDEDTQLALRASLYAGLTAALEALGDVDDVHLLDRGDGVIALLPDRIAAYAVATEALPALIRHLDEYNGAAASPAQMRLRIVLHRGEATSDRWGYLGRDVTMVFRLLDSDDLRRALASVPDAAILAVSRHVWEQFDELPTNEFRKLPPFGRPISLRTKKTYERTWTAPLGSWVSTHVLTA